MTRSRRNSIYSGVVWGGDKNQKPMGDSAWQENGVDIQKAFDEVMTCSEEQGYDIVLVKSRSA